MRDGYKSLTYNSQSNNGSRRAIESLFGIFSDLVVIEANFEYQGVSNIEHLGIKQERFFWGKIVYKSFFRLSLEPG